MHCAMILEHPEDIAPSLDESEADEKNWRNATLKDAKVDVHDVQFMYIKEDGDLAFYVERFQRQDTALLRVSSVLVANPTWSAVVQPKVRNES